MKTVWPDKTGCLCARMSSGLNGQDATGGLLVVTRIIQGGGISSTLDASYYKGTGARNGKEREFLAVSVGNGQTNQASMSEQATTLDCMHDQQAVLTEGKPKRKYIVRRLTPTECLRLQGLPDWWCDGANGSDSAVYRMAGNGIALPCAIDVLGRIAEELQKGDEDDQRGQNQGNDR